MKRKLVMFAMMTVAFGCMLTGCKESSEGNNTNAAEETTKGAVQSEVDEEEVQAFSGDYTQNEEWGYTPFFLKYGYANTEKKDLSDVIFYDCVSAGKSLEDVLRSENFVSYSFKDLETTDVDEVINYDETYTIKSGSYVEVRMYRADESMVKVTIYNITSDALTMAQCVAEGQFYIGDCSDISTEYSGKNAFDLDTEYGIAYLEQLVEMLGKPDTIYYGLNLNMNTDRKDEEETFAESVKMGGGIIGYDLMYQLNGAKLAVGISEYNMYNEYELKDVMVCYCTDDLYIYLRDHTNSGAIVDETRVYE